MIDDDDDDDDETIELPPAESLFYQQNGDGVAIKTIRGYHSENYVSDIISGVFGAQKMIIGHRFLGYQPRLVLSDYSYVSSNSFYHSIKDFQKMWCVDCGKDVDNAGWCPIGLGGRKSARLGPPITFPTPVLPPQVPFFLTGFLKMIWKNIVDFFSRKCWGHLWVADVESGNHNQFKCCFCSKKNIDIENGWR